MEEMQPDDDRYPGTPRHRALLRAVAAYYAGDERILAVIVFGSLGRGNWDRHSDLDLDIVIADDTDLDALDEITRLCASFSTIGEHAGLIISDADDAGDVVLRSLCQLSIRYHPLSTTSPHILDSMRVLVGRIDPALIVAAGEARRSANQEPLALLLDRCVRNAVAVDTAIRRHQMWATIEHLHLMRGLLMQLFARTHQGVRPYHTFQAVADTGLQAALGTTVPRYDMASVTAAFAAMLGLLESDIAAFTDGQAPLTEAHRQILHALRRE